MMCKVLLKDQYTSGYAKKIAGSYTLVAGFVRIRDSNIRDRISYSSLHMTVYMWYTAESRKGTDMLCVGTCTGFLKS